MRPSHGDSSLGHFLPSLPFGQRSTAPTSASPTQAEAMPDLDVEEDEDEHPLSEIPPELLNEKVLRSAYMFTRTEKRKQWKRRWVVLRATRLAFYKNDKEYTLHSVIQAKEMRTVAPVELKREGVSICIVTQDQTLYLRASEPRQTNVWLDDLERTRYAATEPSGIAHMDPKVASPVSSTATPLPATPVVNHAYSYDESAPDVLLSPSTVTSPAHAIRIEPAHNRKTKLEIPMPINMPSQRPTTDIPEGYGSIPHSSSNHPTGLSSSEDEFDDAPGDMLMPLPSEVSAQMQSPAAPSQEDTNRIIAQGYLMKQSHRRKQWRKRWFVLTLDMLYYSRSHMDTRSYRRIPTKTILDVMEYDPPSPSPFGPSLSLSPSSFGLRGFGADARAHGGMPSSPLRDGLSHLHPDSHKPAYCFRIVTTDRSFILCAPTEDEEIQWLSALQTLLNRQRSSAHAPPRT
ncbi:hypothetical protein Malapachy_3742 [Malassezia pachydermatis]|uniref:PH domain-containing protein n=1 Tax=Malassezia pachydermatis TaxID=77020 RepID=A0A0M8MPT6_9BASI|nr:hypothetical protein Malapachy_3742 [Malassezia pachydermatis]KOS14387.1 hypothetical protein Malapachy_3742 [Malassezia pachydermatis]